LNKAQARSKSFSRSAFDKNLRSTRLANANFLTPSEVAKCAAQGSRVQGKANQLIHEIYLAPTRKEALAAFDQFLSSYQVKFPKACQCLEKDKEVLFTFYDFPAQHWPHLRTTNLIESTFAPSDCEPTEARLRFTNCDADHGLQTWPGSPKALAPTPGLRTDPKVNYRRPVRRWRRTTPPAA
jgi:Transposase, Mutator family